MERCRVTRLFGQFWSRSEQIWPFEHARGTETLGQGSRQHMPPASPKLGSTRSVFSKRR